MPIISFKSLVLDKRRDFSGELNLSEYSLCEHIGRLDGACPRGLCDAVLPYIKNTRHDNRENRHSYNHLDE